ncbi:hypothetical protein BHE74_00020231, partial [Ensete ventricosum]
MEVPSRETIEKGSQNEEYDRAEEATHEKIPTNIMCNLAEKAMSIAGPVVPMKDDGEVDQERSWLLEEVAVDLGYYRAIVISGIAFSLIHGYALIGCVF